MTEDKTFLGVVQKKAHRGTIVAATVEPLYQLSADGATWEPIFDAAEKRRLFPNNGCISWLHIDEHVPEGSVWRFKLLVQPSYDDRPDDLWRDRYMVAPWSARPLTEVLDVERLGGEPLGRELLCTRGIRLHQAVPGSLVVRAEGNLWGFLPFVAKEGSPGRYVIDPLVLEQPLRLETHSGTGLTMDIPIGGEVRTFLLPDVKVEGSVTLRDWSPDPLVVRRVMGKLRRWDRSFADTLGLSDKALDRVAAVLAESPLSINELDMERSRFKRARAYLDGLKEAAELASAARTALEEGPLSSEIERERARIVETETTKARELATESIRTEREVATRLREGIKALENERERLVAEIATIRQHQEASIDRLAVELEARLKELIEKPERILADVAIYRAVARILGDASPARHFGSGHVVVPTGAALPHRAANTRCTDLKAFSKLFQEALLANDAPPNIWRAIHASFLGGGVPLLLGARARQSFEAFAKVTTRGEVNWIQVDPTWVSMREVLHGEFGAILNRLRDDTSLHLVVLEGVNRAPMEAYFNPFLAAYAGAWDERTMSTLPLMNGGPNCQAGPIDQRPWPRNVLLGGTVVDGITSLGMPTACLSSCTLVLTDEIRAGAELDLISKDHPSVRNRNAGGKDASEVTLDTWTSWRESATAVGLDAPLEKWGQLAKAHGLSRLGRDRFLATYAAARLTTDDDGPAISDSIAYATLPLLVSNGEDQGLDFDGSGFEYRDIGRAVELIRKLLRT